LGVVFFVKDGWRCGWGAAWIHDDLVYSGRLKWMNTKYVCDITGASENGQNSLISSGIEEIGPGAPE
jgi:hypothetical protein